MLFVKLTLYYFVLPDMFLIAYGLYTSFPHHAVLYTELCLQTISTGYSGWIGLGNDRTQNSKFF